MLTSLTTTVSAECTQTTKKLNLCMCSNNVQPVKYSICPTTARRILFSYVQWMKNVVNVCMRLFCKLSTRCRNKIILAHFLWTYLLHCRDAKFSIISNDILWNNFWPFRRFQRFISSVVNETGCSFWLFVKVKCAYGF